MPVDLSQLNQNQQQAVLWNDGPVLVLAGPGSGKTSVLTLRVARLLQEQADASVLALTFTNKAAAEMRQRVDDLLGERAERAHLCTFHAFATEILRQHGSHLGLRPDFALVAQSEDRMALLEPVIVALENEGYAIPTDRKAIVRLLDHLCAESYDGGAKAPILTETPDWVPVLFSRYVDALIEVNRLDFGSLLILARRLLVQKPGVARVLRLGWSHVSVDEFQDTNRAQYELLKLMVPRERPNLFVVGDDDQIIYQWNGASPERLQSLRDDYEMELIQLPENHRCPPEIVALANRLIGQNRMRTRSKKPLAAQRTTSGDEDVVRYLIYDTPDEEVDAVAADIHARPGGAASECVVLARTKRSLEAAARALEREGLTPYLARRKDDFERPINCVVLQALRLANARHDQEILRRLCVAWEVLTGNLTEVEDVSGTATLVGGDFLRAWVDAATIVAEGPARKLAEKLRVALLDHMDFPGIVDWFLSDGWKPWDVDDVELREELETWQDLHGQFIREYSADNQTLNTYLHFIDLASKVPPRPEGSVRCFTVHGAKGLEFDHVYVIGMAQDLLPSFQAIRKGANSRELEEERRNCFVAITRVKESLTLTRAKKYYGYPKRPSQFLAEMGLTS